MLTDKIPNWLRNFLSTSDGDLQLQSDLDADGNSINNQSSLNSCQRYVGPTSGYDSLSQAIADSNPGETIVIENMKLTSPVAVDKANLKLFFLNSEIETTDGVGNNYVLSLQSDGIEIYSPEIDGLQSAGNKYSGNSGIETDNGVNDCIIKNAEVHHTEYAIKTWDGDNNRILFNECHHIDYGLSFAYAKNHIAFNNEFRDFTTAGIKMRRGNSGKILYNYIHSPDGDNSVNLKGIFGDGSEDLNGGLIQGNYVDMGGIANTEGFFIDTNLADLTDVYMQILNNKVFDADGDYHMYVSIPATIANNTVNGNYSVSSSAEGIRVDANDVNIINNKVRNISGGYGGIIVNGAKRVDIGNNELDNSVNHAIRLTGTAQYVRIYNNDLLTSLRGIRLDDTATDIYLLNNNNQCSTKIENNSNGRITRNGAGQEATSGNTPSNNWPVGTLVEDTDNNTVYLQVSDGDWIQVA